MNPEQFKQERLFRGSGDARVVKPLRALQQGVKRYAQSQGLNYSDKGLSTLQNDHQRGFATAQAYKGALVANNVNTPEVMQSYGAMREDLGKQYSFLTRPQDQGGMGIKHEVTPEDPYNSLQAAHQDLVKNNTVKTLATASTGSHKVFSDQENDQFRFVHDVYGHLATGRNFSRHGEEAAYQAHRQVFSPASQRALAVETRGQNSFLNYGPTGQFVEQADLPQLPAWAHSNAPLQPAQQPAPKGPRPHQLRLPGVS